MRGFSFKILDNFFLFSSDADETVKEDVCIYPPSKFTRMAISSGKLINGVPDSPMILEPFAPSKSL